MQQRRGLTTCFKFLHMRDSSLVIWKSFGTKIFLRVFAQLQPRYNSFSSLRMNRSAKEAQGLLDFINVSPSRKFSFVKRDRTATKWFVAFHAVYWVKQRLVEAEFKEIQVCSSHQYLTPTLPQPLMGSQKERNSWHETCRPGGKYYLTRNGSAIVAFAIGKNWKVR